LEAIQNNAIENLDIEFIKNIDKGPHSAIRTGFRASTASAVLVHMADDDYNANIIDLMVEKLLDGCDVVAASRFVAGGNMGTCSSRFKEQITKWGAFAFQRLTNIPTKDPTNGFRLFSRRLIDEVEIESRVGFTYSIELLVKSSRRGWRVEEVPAQWFERNDRESRFRALRWLPAYLRWLIYAITTSVFRSAQLPQTDK
jgi:hypothetical protein